VSGSKYTWRELQLLPTETAVVNGRGNPWVIFGVPLPLPTKPLPVVRGTGFFRGTNFETPTQPVPVPLTGYPQVFQYIEAGDIVIFNYVS
jgi:hypothetical protein